MAGLGRVNEEGGRAGRGEGGGDLPADMAALADTADDDPALRDPACRIRPGGLVEEVDGLGEGRGERAVERGGERDEARLLRLDGPPGRGGGMRRALALRLLRRLPLGE